MLTNSAILHKGSGDGAHHKYFSEASLQLPPLIHAGDF